MSESMMVNDAAMVICPKMGKILVVNVTTTSAIHDLTAANRLAGEESKNFLTFKADGGKVWFFFNNANSGTVDETADTAAGTPANQCYMLDNGQREDFKLVDGFTWLVVKGSATCRLRIFRSGASGAGTTR